METLGGSGLKQSLLGYATSSVFGDGGGRAKGVCDAASNSEYESNTQASITRFIHKSIHLSIIMFVVYLSYIILRVPVLWFFVSKIVFLGVLGDTVILGRVNLLPPCSGVRAER